jgi:hypothetical protein
VDRTTPSWIRSVLTLALIGSLAGFVSPVWAQAENVALSGRIFQSDGATPYANVTVRVIDQETGQAVASTTTGTDGSYAFETLDPGTYTFEVEVSDGVYQLDRAIQMGMDEQASISFTIKPTDDGGGAAAGGAAAATGMSATKKGLIIASIAFGAIVVGYLVYNNDDDEPNNEGSPFTP